MCGSLENACQTGHDWRAEVLRRLILAAVSWARGVTTVTRSPLHPPISIFSLPFKDCYFLYLPSDKRFKITHCLVLSDPLFHGMENIF
jgi:hypothetical protein